MCMWERSIFAKFLFAINHNLRRTLRGSVSDIKVSPTKSQKNQSKEILNLDILANEFHVRWRKSRCLILWIDWFAFWSLMFHLRLQRSMEVSNHSHQHQIWQDCRQLKRDFFYSQDSRNGSGNHDLWCWTEWIWRNEITNSRVLAKSSAGGGALPIVRHKVGVFGHPSRGYVDLRSLAWCLLLRKRS